MTTIFATTGLYWHLKLLEVCLASLNTVATAQTTGEAYFLYAFPIECVITWTNKL